MSTIDLVRDRPPAPPPEPQARDERAAMRVFIQREREKTDLIRLRRGLGPLYVEEGDRSAWPPTGAASTEQHEAWHIRRDGPDGRGLVRGAHDGHGDRRDDGRGA